MCKGKGSKNLATKAALASDDEGGKGPELDLASSPELPPEAAMDVTGWPLDRIAAFKKIVNELVEKMEGRDRPALDDIKGEVEEVPQAVLEATGLAKVVGDFRKKTRYPKTDTLKKLAAQWLVLSVSDQRHGGSPGPQQANGSNTKISTKQCKSQAKPWNRLSPGSLQPESSPGSVGSRLQE